MMKSRPLLRAVSRSFYLTLRALPAAIRDPISLGYLLARATDTIADAAQAPTALREETLRAFSSTTAEVLLPTALVEAEGLTPGERELLAGLPICFADLDALPPEDQVAIRSVIAHIIRGQLLDLERFADPRQIRALPDAEALEEYIYLVAGSVGEFWTDLCLRHRLIAGAPEDELRRLGVNFGKGLQLVNILRDQPADLAAGRAYLPSRYGITAPEELADWWMVRAESYLADAAIYLTHLRRVRLRFACFLPWRLGVETLAALKKNPPLRTRQRVKVSRAQVRAAMWAGAVFALLPARRPRV